MKRKILSTIAFLMAFLCSQQDVSAQDIMSAGGTLTVSHENTGNANENSSKLVDNNLSSKFLLFNFNSIKPIWMQWQANTAVRAGIYTLTSGGDAPARDPKNWTIQGSNNGTTWTVLDTRTNEVFEQRGMTKLYFMPENTTAYTYYRFTVTENSGDGLFQLAEWRLLGATAPAAPADLVAIAPAGTEIVVSWKDMSATETAFEVETSTDGTNFTRIETLGNNSISYTHTGLAVSSRHYYRVRSINPFGNSVYSNIAEATTLEFPESLIDLTNNGGQLTVQFENTGNANENSSKLIDNNPATKYLVGNANVWIQYVSTDKAILTKYTFTSANDAPNRDPKNWVLEGSNNGTDWTPLDTRNDEVFTTRAQKKTYIIANTRPFNIYKMTITSNGANAFQVAEWELWGRKLEVPAGPGNLTVKALSETEIKITWKDNSDKETGYELERSKDGITYASHKILPANTEEFTDTGLSAGEAYYYRVSATSLIGNSVYSNVAATRTKGGEVGLPIAKPSSILTPNGDGVNDRWTIQNLEYYKKNEVKIFDRAGRLVFHKENYANEWNGTSSGSPLAEGTYIYVVRFWPGVPDLTGVLTIVRDR